MKIFISILDWFSGKIGGQTFWSLSPKQLIPVKVLSPTSFLKNKKFHG